MATFLELARDVARESGTLDPLRITGVVGQSGRAERIVNWTRKAWTDIQNSRVDWRWMKGGFSSVTVANQAIYTPANLGITRFGAWLDETGDYPPFVVSDPAIAGSTSRGSTDDRTLEGLDPDEFIRRYQRGNHTSGRPIHWIKEEADGLFLGPTPDKAYRIAGIYQKGPQTLAADGDIPEMPARFHELIVWEALRLSMIHDGAYKESGWPATEASRLRSELEHHQLPEIRL